jgi:hypothetical protein
VIFTVDFLEQLQPVLHHRQGFRIISLSVKNVAQSLQGTCNFGGMIPMDLLLQCEAFSRKVGGDGKIATIEIQDTQVAQGIGEPGGVDITVATEMLNRLLVGTLRIVVAAAVVMNGTECVEQSSEISRRWFGQRLEIIQCQLEEIARFFRVVIAS